MNELTLEQRSKRYNLIKSVSKKLAKAKADKLTERRRAFEFQQDLKRLGA